MENFSVYQVALTFLIALVVGLIIPVYKEVSAKLKERRALREAAEQKLLSQNAELRKIELAEDERNSQETWKIVEFWKNKCEACEKKVAQLEIGRSLPSAMVTELYKAIAALGREMATVEMMVLRGENIEIIKEQNQKVRTCYEILNGILP